MPRSSLSNPGGIHLSEAKFRAYEEVIKDFLATYPNTYRMKPVLAVSTTVVRLREAVNALLTQSDRGETYITDIDIDLLRSLWPLVQVSGFRDEVMIGEPKALGISRQVKLQMLHEKPPMHTVNDPTVANLLSLYDLLLSGAFSGPIALTGSIPEFACPPGVIMQRQQDGSYIML